MSQPTDHGTPDRLTLPPAPPAEHAHPLGAPGTALHVCPACSSQLVVPVAWQEAGRAHWDVTLVCPNCDWLGGGVYDEDQVERFDEELDRGTEALVRDLRRLTRANMEDDVDRFVAALAADAIWPMDF
jgi:hypothetical protein